MKLTIELYKGTAEDLPRVLRDVALRISVDAGRADRLGALYAHRHIRNDDGAPIGQWTYEPDRD